MPMISNTNSTMSAMPPRMGMMTVKARMPEAREQSMDPMKIHRAWFTWCMAKALFRQPSMGRTPMER